MAPAPVSFRQRGRCVRLTGFREGMMTGVGRMGGRTIALGCAAGQRSGGCRHAVVAIVVLMAALLGCAPRQPDEGQPVDQGETVFTFETVTFSAADGLQVTADLYRGRALDAPTVVLFHQSASSRGEYRTVAPRLQALGYNALAVDLRWGRARNDVENITARRNGTEAVMAAVEAGAGSPWETIDASWMDVVAAIDWVESELPSSTVVAVGSSFSAMLVVRLAAEGGVGAVAAFSPGEYDADRPELVRGWARQATAPVLAIAAVEEAELVRPIYESLPESLGHFHQARVGRHGASIMDEDDANFDLLASFLGHVVGGPPAHDEMRLPGPRGELFVDRYDGPGEAGVIALFHQGGGSARGEYGFLIAGLLDEGYDVMASDLHGGGDRFGFINRTLAATPEPADFSYCDAAEEMMAVLEAAARWKPEAELVGWGSSYSGALILHAASEGHVDRVLAFSPASGEPMVGCDANSVADRLTVPALILRPENEAGIESVASQLDLFRGAGHQTWVASPGVHGSSMLNPFRVRDDVSSTRRRVMEFLRDPG